MQLDTYNLDGEKVGSVEIQDKLIQFTVVLVLPLQPQQQLR